ncbi:hypothetical protein SAMN05421833_105304 [Microbispora rosea]|uniref:DUF4386 family protein n=1 Tax=Microbispora rosea TaxID=58117 RepID=A0A1N6XVJ4_9ACTN|nr:hypothetical protein [Microbispora rosea]GIH51116.1 hypothetical protein Mro03_62950 [Microbispora rosea subsp. rosea]SIR06388.1 hypothetical protein SAMN05421833_105304 [Microbispora rosea]
MNALTTTTRRPMGTLLATASLIAGPALIGLALASLPDLWNGDRPDYQVIDADHGLALLSFNLAALAFPFLFGSAVVLALAARRSSRLAATGLVCGFLGLTAMFGNAMLSVPLVLMNGLPDHGGLDQLAGRLDSPPLLPLLLFPLFIVGSALQALSLWRSRAIPGWAAAAVGLGGLFPAAMVLDVPALAVPIAALRIAGSIPVITMLNRKEIP